MLHAKKRPVNANISDELCYIRRAI